MLKLQFFLLGVLLSCVVAAGVVLAKREYDSVLVAAETHGAEIGVQTCLETLKDRLPAMCQALKDADNNGAI